MLRIIAIALTAISCSTLWAQDTTITRSTWKSRVGFVFTPQASFDFCKSEDLEAATNQFATLIFVTTFSKDRTTLVPFYSFNSTALGYAGIYKLEPKCSLYTVGQKNLLNERGYASLGAMTPVANGLFNGFVEFGSGIPEWSPAIYTGVFMGLTRPIRDP